jgi:hypothetical protein
MAHRRTYGIISDDKNTSNPAKEADAIMTAVAVGFSASEIVDNAKRWLAHVKDDKTPPGYPALEFTMDPLDKNNKTKDPSGKEVTEWENFQRIVGKLRHAVASWVPSELMTLDGHDRLKEDLSPDFKKMGVEEGSVIMGVYHMAGQKPIEVFPVTKIELSKEGAKLLDDYKKMTPFHYNGRGAYTGFVDNPKAGSAKIKVKKFAVGEDKQVDLVVARQLRVISSETTENLGPLATARFEVPSDLCRWLPPEDSPLWAPRKRAGGDTYIPWGMIGGELANKAYEYGDKSKNPAGDANHDAYVERVGEKGKNDDPTKRNWADQLTWEMETIYGMRFLTIPQRDHDILAYPHGLIQATCWAYQQGPAYRPYEIAVGNLTTKLASCFTCSLFLYSVGYPPTAIHLGRGESWTPVFHPYHPEAVQDDDVSKCVEVNPVGDNPLGQVISDLNVQWGAKLTQWLITGLRILSANNKVLVKEAYHGTIDTLYEYVLENKTASGWGREHTGIFVPDGKGGTEDIGSIIGGILVCDAVTMHDSETKRLDRVLAEVGP